MNTNKNPKRERIELEEGIQRKEWFKLLPEYARRNLLEQPSGYLALLLEHEAIIVTTDDVAGFTFGYDTEGKPIIRMPEYSASAIGVAKLNKLKLQPQDKMKFVIENIRLMRRPLSDKKKKLIASILEKIGDDDLWTLGAMIEEKTRRLQLEIETGRTITPYLPNLVVDRKEEAEIPGIVLGNYLWLWKQILVNSKTVRFHRSVSPLYFAERMRTEEEKPQRLYQIECGCGKMTTVYAIGPFSALKLAGSFPIDDPERYRFWEHKYGCRTTTDEFCFAVLSEKLV